MSLDFSPVYQLNFCLAFWGALQRKTEFRDRKSEIRNQKKIKD